MKKFLAIFRRKRRSVKPADSYQHNDIDYAVAQFTNNISPKCVSHKRCMFGDKPYECHTCRTKTYDVYQVFYWAELYVCCHCSESVRTMVNEKDFYNTILTKFPNMENGIAEYIAQRYAIMPLC